MSYTLNSGRPKYDHFGFRLVKMCRCRECTTNKNRDDKRIHTKKY